MQELKSGILADTASHDPLESQYGSGDLPGARPRASSFDTQISQREPHFTEDKTEAQLAGLSLRPLP